jgi:isoamylase
VFRRNRFLAGAEAADLRWYTPAGAYLEAWDWSDPNALAIALYLDGSDDPDRADDGTPLADDDFLVLVNAWWQPLDFVLPATRPQARWRVEIDTYDPANPTPVGNQVTVRPRSVVVLRDRREEPPPATKEANDADLVGASRR